MKTVRAFLFSVMCLAPALPLLGEAPDLSLIHIYQVDTPAELAAIFHASHELGLKGGMLVTNPIPEEYSMDADVINAAIDQAVAECKAQGIHGKATTPFLLARIKDITGGDSLDSNIQLVFNNARLAARTAGELSKLG